MACLRTVSEAWRGTVAVQGGNLHEPHCQQSGDTAKCCGARGEGEGERQE